MNTTQNSDFDLQSGNTLKLPKTSTSPPKVPKSPSASSELSSSCSCQSVNRIESQGLAQLGELKFAIHYLLDSKQLCVELIKAENLGQGNSNINPFAKICLMPGKAQKQTSSVEKHTLNPVYNQKFYFKDLSLDQVQDMKLRIRFYHKSQNLRKDDFLGEMQTALTTFDLLQETRLWKELEPKSQSEVSCFT